MPTTLLRSDYAEKQEHTDTALTVYSCRLSTGFGRGAAASDPMSGVNLCLIGQDGRTVMHRISPLNDPEEAQEEVEHMCEIIDDGVGADCTSALNQIQQSRAATAPSSSPSSTSSSSYVLQPKPPPAPKPRFQEGTVDEVVFLAPELGPLAAVLVGMESGSWVCDEVQVSSSRTHHIDRFICRRLLGAQPGQGAAYLTPVPAGAVVYGTGDAAMMLSKEQANALQTINMDAYEGLKQRLLTTTAILTAGGSGVAALAAGVDAAIPFALGGVAGVTYQWLLQQGVDNIVATATAGQTGRRLHSAASYDSGSGSSSSSSSGSHSGGPPSSRQQQPYQPTAAASNKPMYVDFAQVDLEGRVLSTNSINGFKEQQVLRSPEEPPKSGLQDYRPGASIQKLLATPAVRLAFVAALAVLGATTLGGGGGAALLGSTSPSAAATEGVAAAGSLLPVAREQLWQLVIATLGFMTYKVALVSVALSTPPPQPDLVKAQLSQQSSDGKRNRM